MESLLDGGYFPEVAMVGAEDWPKQWVTGQWGNAGKINDKELVEEVIQHIWSAAVDGFRYGSYLLDDVMDEKIAEIKNGG